MVEPNIGEWLGGRGLCCPDSLLELETKRTLDVEINSFPNKNCYVPKIEHPTNFLPSTKNQGQVSQSCYCVTIWNHKSDIVDVEFEWIGDV